LTFIKPKSEQREDWDATGCHAFSIPGFALLSLGLEMDGEMASLGSSPIREGL
jgi:hypothetical protein